MDMNTVCPLTEVDRRVGEHVSSRNLLRLWLLRSFNNQNISLFVSQYRRNRPPPPWQTCKQSSVRSCRQSDNAQRKVLRVIRVLRRAVPGRRNTLFRQSWLRPSGDHGSAGAWREFERCEVSESHNMCEFCPIYLGSGMLTFVAARGTFELCREDAGLTFRRW